LKELYFYDGTKWSVRVTEGFVDSNFVGCLDLRKSLTDYVFTSYGIVISWKANL